MQAPQPFAPYARPLGPHPHNTNLQTLALLTPMESNQGAQPPQQTDTTLNHGTAQPGQPRPRLGGNSLTLDENDLSEASSLGLKINLQAPKPQVQEVVNWARSNLAAQYKKPGQKSEKELTKQQVAKENLHKNYPSELAFTLQTTICRPLSRMLPPSRCGPNGMSHSPNCQPQQGFR